MSTVRHALSPAHLPPGRVDALAHTFAIDHGTFGEPVPVQ